MNTFKERLYAGHGQYLAVNSVLCVCHTDYQDVLIFEIRPSERFSCWMASFSSRNVTATSIMNDYSRAFIGAR